MKWVIPILLAGAIAWAAYRYWGLVKADMGETLLKWQTPAQIAQYAQNAGFSGTDLQTAVAVALAESSGKPNALGDTDIGSGTGSFGLWQINADAHPEYGPDFSGLYDPQTNANAAFAIYSQAGDSFSPWSTFRSGAYAEFMSKAATAVGTA